MHKLGIILAFVFNKVFLLSLFLLLSVGVPLIGVASTFTSSEAVLSILSEAEVYTTVPDNILDIIELEDDDAEAEPVCTSPSQPGLPDCQFDGQQPKQPAKTVRQVLEENGLIDPDELITRVKAALDPTFLESQVAELVNGVYGYLDESSDRLEFEVSLRDRSDAVVNELRAFVTSSLDSLPQCGPSDVQSSEEIEIFDITCLPPGSDIEQEIGKFIDELEAEDGVLGEVLTPEDLDISETDLQGAKIAYQAASAFSLWFWLVVIGVSFAAILTSKTLHRGFKEVGILYAVLGFLFLVAFGTLTSSMEVGEIVIENQDDLTAAQQQAIRNIADPVARELMNDISGHVVKIGIAMVTLGAGSFILGLQLTKHHVEHIQFHHPQDEKTQDSVYPEPSKGRSAAAQNPTPGKDIRAAPKKKPPQKTKAK